MVIIAVESAQIVICWLLCIETVPIELVVRLNIALVVINYKLAMD